MFAIGGWGVLGRAIAVLGIALAPALASAQETTLRAPGASADLQQRLRDASAAMAAKANGLETPQELLAAAASDYRTLIQILYDQGYFSPVINIRVDGREVASILGRDPPRSVRRIEILVKTGPAFRFGRTVVAPLAPGTELPRGFATGLPAGTGILRDAANAGIAGWQQAGHAKAEIADQRITANHRDAVLDADIRLRPGPRLRFGTMTVSGGSAVRPEAIARIAGFPTGEVYDPDQLHKVATRLRRTGAFSSISIREAAIANPDGTLDFDAAIGDQPARRISFGVELSSRDGLDLSAAWTHRNLFGAAERLQLEARVRSIGGPEPIDGLVTGRLDRPATLGPDDNMFYLAEFERLNKPHYQLWRTMLGIGARRVFSDTLYSELTLSPNFSRADDAFGINREFRTLALSLRTEWDRRDIPVNATNGFFLDTLISPYAGVSGTASGLRATIDARGYVSPLGSDAVVLAGRVQIGSVLGVSQPEISPDMLFYSGGAGTVRGFRYESLGVPVGTDTAGGRSMLAMSAEIRARLGEKFSVVGFVDFGAVDGDQFVDRNSIYHSGAGIGLRYDVGGLGPLRLDLALPVAGEPGTGLQFYLGIGQAF